MFTKQEKKIQEKEKIHQSFSLTTSLSRGRKEKPSFSIFARKPSVSAKL
jgi:hypothetical protein